MVEEKQSLKLKYMKAETDLQTHDCFGCEIEMRVD